MTDSQQSRNAQRKSIMMLASVSIDNGEWRSVRVRNLSATGMAGVSDQPFRSNSKIGVRFNDRVEVNGRVVRSDGRAFAIAFDMQIDLSLVEVGSSTTLKFEVSEVHKVPDNAKRPRLKP
jgi:hypothetical protein